jgi:hypothetical protein
MGLFLNPVGDPADQQIAAQPRRRYGLEQPAPFDPEIGGRQFFERDDPGLDIGTRPIVRAIPAAEKPAGFPASLLVPGNRRHAPAAAMR